MVWSSALPKDVEAFARFLRGKTVSTSARGQNLLRDVKKGGNERYEERR